MAEKDKPKKKCFVVGPIGDPGSEDRVHADWLFETIIVPTMKQFENYEHPIRADKISQPGLIDAQIIRLLLDADLVIADLSRLSANAFYEIGIRHMVQKPIVHMQHVDDKIPFDVSLYRAIKFSLRQPADLEEARRQLSEFVGTVTAEDYKIENPVTSARGQIKIEQSATPEHRVILDQLSALNRRMSILEQTGVSSLPSYASLLASPLPTLPAGASATGFVAEIRVTFGAAKGDEKLIKKIEKVAIDHANALGGVARIAEISDAGLVLRLIARGSASPTRLSEFLRDLALAGPGVHTELTEIHPF